MAPGNSSALDALGGAIGRWLWRGGVRRGGRPSDLQLQRAVERAEFDLSYQPVIDTFTGQIAGAEALLRWSRGGSTPMVARTFVPRLERLGLLPRLTAPLLDSLCDTVRRAHSAGHEALYLSLNVSQDQILARDFSVSLGSALASAGVPPRALHLEVSERTLAEAGRETYEVLNRMASLGVRLVVDDFWGIDDGLFQKLNGVAAAKMDIAGNAHGTQAGFQLVEAAEVARSLKIPLIGKRVETDEDMSFSRELGCDYRQGNAYAEAMTARELLGALASLRKTAAAA